jgi:transcription elongation factor GreB
LNTGKDMSRYRPPSKPATKIITPEGAVILKNELDFLWKTKRPEITQAVSEAAAQGDRSENAEYIYGKKQLREIDARIRFLRKRLDNMQIINQLPPDKGRVYFGAWISLEDVDGNNFKYRIVGPDEFDREAEYISVDSPMARALLGKRVDDEVKVNAPDGVRELYIVKIHYEATK